MRALSFLCIISLLVSLIVLYLYFDLRQQLSAEGNQQEVSLVDTMHKFQLYADKLFFAGEARNWELAHFYHHELEEHVEELEEAGITENGQNLSQLAAQMTSPGMEELEQSIAQKDSPLFSKGYQMLINGCNSCHSVSKHAYIKIALPKVPAFSNQVYSLE